MPSTDRKLELKAKTSVAQTGSQPYVCAKGLNAAFAIEIPDLISEVHLPCWEYVNSNNTLISSLFYSN
jgi:hypothetical protein